MKKIIVSSLLLIFSVILNSQNMIHQTLKNGMEVIVKENKSNDSVTLQCFVKTGSIHEKEYLGMGLSHYLEHVVSGGTTKYRTEEEYSQMGQQIGGIVNAYTTYDKTAYHITTDKSNFDTALKMLSEQVTSCLIDSFEVAREKEVILKEIVMRSTPVQSRIYQRFMELSYPNSPLSSPIIGYVENFKECTREQLNDYYQRRYVPNNMIFTASGNLKAKDMMDKISEIFSTYPREIMEPVIVPETAPYQFENKVIEEFPIKTATTYINYIIPKANYQDAFALEIALDYLFSKRTSPVNDKLREKLNLINYIYAGVNCPNSFPQGSLSIIFEAKNTKDTSKIINIIDEEIAKVYKKNFPKKAIDDFIKSKETKNNLSAPSSINETNILGINFINYDNPDTKEIDKAYKNISTKDLKNVVKKYLLPKKRLVFMVVPEGEKDNSHKKEKKSVTSDKTIIKEKNNIKLFYKFSDRKPLVRVSIGLPGISDEFSTPNETGKFQAFVDLLFKGSKKYNSIELSNWLQENLITISTDLSAYGLNVNFSCSVSNLEEMEKILIDAFSHPSYDEKELTQYKNDWNAYAKRSSTNASNNHSNFRSKKLYERQINALTNTEKSELIQKLSSDDLKETFNKYFSSKNMIITIVGDISEEKAWNFAKKIKNTIPKKDPAFQRHPMSINKFNEKMYNYYDFDQVNIDFNIVAPSINDKDYNTFRVIEAILSGSRRRLFKAVRGTSDLAYYAFAKYTATKNSGFFRISTQTSPSKTDELVNVINDELKKLIDVPVSKKEISEAIEEQEKMVKAMITDKSYHIIYTTYEMNGYGYDYFEKFKESLKDVTPQDIQNAAKKYFDNIAIFISTPKNPDKVMVQ